jgi:hypothetical protein
MSRPAAQVSCVAENRPDWYRQVENLAITLRNFGGRLASAQFVAHFVGGVDDVQGQLLRELGAELRAVTAYPAPKPTTNKLRMFEHFARNSDAELLIALDCDTVIVGDLLDEAVPGAVAAVGARRSPLNADEWTRLLARLALPLSSTPTLMISTGEAVPVPYVNSGVLMVPRCHAEALVTGWTEYVDRFAAEARSGCREPWTKYFMDQVALTCAFLDRNIPVEIMGRHINVPTAVDDAARLERAEALSEGHVERVKVLHYHRHITKDGRLLPTDKGSPLNHVIDRVNSVVQSRARRPRRRDVSQLWARGRSQMAKSLSRLSS